MPAINTSDDTSDAVLGSTASATDAGSVIYSPPSDEDRRGEYRYPANGVGHLKIGGRWHKTNLINRSCSGFQVALTRRKKVAPGKILHFRSEAGEFLVRIVRVNANGELGLEWIDEANQYSGSLSQANWTRPIYWLLFTIIVLMICSYLVTG